MAIDSDDMTMRTEMPTPLRLAEARRRGQVARSADLTAVVVLLAVAAVVLVLGPWLLGSLTAMTATMLSQAGQIAPLQTAAGGVFTKPAVTFLAYAAPMMLTAVVVAAAVGIMQVGWLVSSEPLRPQAERLSLAAGLRRIFSPRSTARGAFGVVKVLLVSTVAYAVIKPAISRCVSAAALTPTEMISEAGSLAVALIVRLGAVLVVLALLEWVYQRWQYRQDLKMTRRQWREDMRRMEGAGRGTRRASRTARGDFGR